MNLVVVRNTSTVHRPRNIFSPHRWDSDICAHSCNILICWIFIFAAIRQKESSIDHPLKRRSSCLMRFRPYWPLCKTPGYCHVFQPPQQQKSAWKSPKTIFVLPLLFPSVLLPRCFRSLRCRNHQSRPWRLDLPPWRKPLPRRHHGCRQRNGSSFGGQAQVGLKPFWCSHSPKKTSRSIPWKCLLKCYLFLGTCSFLM